MVLGPSKPGTSLMLAVRVILGTSQHCSSVSCEGGLVNGFNPYTNIIDLIGKQMV